MNLDALLDELLKRGVADWVHDAEVAWIAKSIGGARSKPEVQEIALNLVQAALEQELMTIGNLTRDGFQTWKMPTDQAVRLARHEWSASGGPHGIGDLFWLSNTPSGDERGRALLGS